MKRILLILLLVTVPPLWGGTVQLSNDESVKLQGFIKGYLGLSSNESGLFRKLSIHVDPQMDQKLSGHTVDDGSGRIMLSPSLMEGDRTYVLATIVHEMIHQFTYRLRGHDEDLYMEGLALLGEFLFIGQEKGKAVAIQSFATLVHPALEMRSMPTAFSQSKGDYGLGFLYFLFLYDNFQGNHFTSSYVRCKKVGAAGISHSLKEIKRPLLVPAQWQDAAFLTKMFFKSLDEGRNVLAITVTDTFSQVLSDINLR